MPEMLTMEDLMRLFACSRSHVKRLVARGRLPMPVKLGLLARWRQCDIRPLVGEYSLREANNANADY